MSATEQASKAYVDKELLKKASTAALNEEVSARQTLAAEVEGKAKKSDLAGYVNNAAYDNESKAIKLMNGDSPVVSIPLADILAQFGVVPNDGSASSALTLIPVYGGNGKKFSDWNYEPELYEAVDSSLDIYGGIEWHDGQWQLIGSPDGIDIDLVLTWAEAPEDALSVVLPKSYTSVAVTATRTANPIIGYQLGLQSDRQLATKEQGAKADAALPKSGGTITGNVAFGNYALKPDGTIQFTDGSTQRVITLPTAAGGIALKSDIAYPIVNHTVTNGEVSLVDHAVNTLNANNVGSTLTLRFPERALNQATDFYVSIFLGEGQQAPNILAPGGLLVDEVGRFADMSLVGAATTFHLTALANELFNASLYVVRGGNNGAGLDSATKSALTTFFSYFASLIPHLAFIDSQHNGGSVADAANACAAALAGDIVTPTPTPTPTTYTITKTLSHCSISNAATSITANSSYTATLSADTDYDIDSVTVTMGGVDVTSTAWTSGTSTISIASVTGNIVITASATAQAGGEETTTYTVTQTLTHCSNSNGATSVDENGSYSATISAASGYMIDSVAVSMGGVDITSTAYNSSAGAISIASVTGNIVITASAVAIVLSSISAVLNLGGATITTSNSVSDLKQYLTVTATYSDNSTATVQSSSYTLSGTLTEGTSTITVSYGGKTTTFTVSVSASSVAPGELSSISASLNLNGATIYDFNSYDDLRQYLTVTANYGDGTSSTLSSTDYALSGPMAGGATNTITVSYGGKTTTFTVAVTTRGMLTPMQLPTGYTQLDYIQGTTASPAYCDLGISAAEVTRAKYGIQERHDPSSNTKGHVISSKRTYFPYFKQSSFAQANNGNETIDSGGSTSYTWTKDTTYIIEGFPDVYINGVLQCNLQKGTSSDDNVNLWALTYGGQPNSNFKADIRLYFLRVYGTNHQLVRNLVPCKNDSDVPGLYDMVTGNFYSSSSGKAFGAGNALVS